LTRRESSPTAELYRGPAMTVLNRIMLEETPFQGM